MLKVWDVRNETQSIDVNKIVFLTMIMRNIF